ncbi:YbaK/EbsC family protein [Calidifontibacter terrae]
MTDARPDARGALTWRPLADAPGLVAPPVAAAGVDGLLVASIDETLADTAAFCAAYGVDLAVSANCVVVQGRRGEVTTTAAIVVLATDRADVNKVVRKHLDVRKISFADQAATEADAGMTSGGITPIGLPGDWPILVDSAVAAAPELVIGGGARGAKLLVSGATLAALPNAQVLDLTLPSE